MAAAECRTTAERIRQVAALLDEMGFPMPRDADGEPTLSDLVLEQYTLSSLLINPQWLEQHIAVGCVPGDYVYPLHQLMFASLVALWDAGTPIDWMSLHRRLSGQTLYEEVGGPTHLNTMIAGCFQAALSHSGWWGEMVHDLGQRRRLAGMGPLVARAAADAPDLHAAIAAAETILARCVKDTGTALVSHHTSDILARMGEVDGYPVAWQGLHYYTGDMAVGQVWSLLGTSSHGKTSVALEMVRVALGGGQSVAYFNLDSSSETLLARLIALEAGVDRHVAAKGHDLPVGHFIGDAVRWARGKLEVGGAWHDQLKVYSSYRDLDRVLAEARRHKAQYGLQLVVVDFIQNLSVQSARGSEYEALNTVMRDFQQFVQLERCTALLLSQTSIEQQKGQRVTDAINAKGSGAVKDVSDVCLLAYRDRFNDDAEIRRHIDLTVLKSKEGPTGVVALEIDFSTGRIHERDLKAQPRDYQDWVNGGMH